MSLVLYKQPQAIDLVHNHLFFQIKGTDYVMSNGKRAVLSLLVNELPETGDALEITFMGQTHRFYFTGDFLPAPPEGYDAILPIKSAESIYLSLSSYTPLTDFYDIQYTWDEIIINALVDGPDYNITHGDVPNGWTTSTIDGELGDYRPNYHFLVQLFANKLSDVGTFTALPEFRIDPDNDQLSHINVGKLLSPRFRNYFELPDFNLSAPSKALIPAVSYYLAFKEMSDSNTLGILTTTTFKVINGKVNKADHPRFNLRTWIGSQKKFLTNMPNQLYTYAGAKHYLYFLSPFSATTAVRVKLEINSKEGDIEHISAEHSLKQDEILIVPVTQMVAALGNIDKVVSVSISLIDADGTTVANAINYYFLPKQIHNRAFLFQNRLGGFDTIITRKQKNTFKVEKEEQRRILTPDYSPYLGDLSSDEPDNEDTFTAETAPVSAAMVQHYKEMAASRVAFLQSDDRWIRVWVESGSFSCVDEDKDLHIFKFTYKPMFDGDILSTELSLPEPEHEDYSQEYLKTDYQ